MKDWLRFSIFLWLFLAAVSLCGHALANPVAVLVPSQPGIERQPAPQNGKNKKQPSAPEVDILIASLEPYAQSGEDMDMPQMFAQIIRNPGQDGGDPTAERSDLLVDVEEIRYLDKRAWGANLAIGKPGLYQYIMEARPRWDEKRGVYSMRQAKVILPVFGVDAGWHLPTGQHFEILPLTRPFGLSAPAMFAGLAILDGKPCPNIMVRMGRINSPKKNAPTEWHKTLEGRTDDSGQFAFTLNQPGWWYCEAIAPADPLKGQDGKAKPAENSTALWLYVDAL